jgi:hypothetical protein
MTSAGRGSRRGRQAIGVAVALLAAAVLVHPALPAAASDVRWRRHVSLPVGVAVDDWGRVVTLAQRGSPWSSLVVTALGRDERVRWERAWRPSGATVTPVDVAVSPDGAVAVTGYLHDVDCVEPFNATWFVRVWDADGSARWGRSGGWQGACQGAGGNVTGDAIAIGDTAVVAALGSGSEYSASTELVALDAADGTLRWRHPWRVPGATNDEVRDLAMGPDGSVYVAGVRDPDRMESDDDQDAVLQRLGAGGARRWTRILPDPADRIDFDVGSSVAVMAGRVAFGAVLDRPEGPSLARIGLVRRDGASIWSRRFAGRYPGGLGPSHGNAYVAFADERVWLAGTETDGAGRIRLSLRAFGPRGRVVWKAWLGSVAHRWWAAGLAGGGGAAYPLAENRHQTRGVVWRIA